MEAAQLDTDSNDALKQVAKLAAEHIGRRRSDPVVPKFDRAELERRVAEHDFTVPMPAVQAAEILFSLLRDAAVRSDHPRYFGLFNPPALMPAIIGDLVADAVNPQLAVWSHAPAAVEIERHLINVIGRFIWDQPQIAGTFTSGGSEANHTALLCALASRYPAWSSQGLKAVDANPAIYVSAEAHLAWIKIAKAAGLGAEAVRLVATNDGLSLDGPSLAAAIAQDKAQDPALDPVLIVATAGTTAHGSIDDMAGLAEVSRAHRAHFHVDAAWAGGALLSPTHLPILKGIEEADSVTIDPHKLLAVPMGCGLYLARDWDALQTAFEVSTGYMPSASTEHRDPYIHSLQWSRRFNGAKLFTAFATLGKTGYAAMIDRQFELGERLRNALSKSGFSIVNDTQLPVICFAPSDSSASTVDSICEAVVASGEAWLSKVKLRGKDCLRACITSFETNEGDVDALVETLVRVRDQAG